MKKPVNENKGPSPDGVWRYRDPSGIERSDPHLKAMMAKVANLREGFRAMGRETDLANGWQDRVKDEMCAQHPEINCRDFGKPYHKPLFADYFRFGQTMMAWARTKETVSQEEAERRASICAGCPKNTATATCAKSCKETLDWIFDMTAGKSTSRDHQLHGCEVCACLLKVKVWVPLDAVSFHGISKEDFPSFCWQIS